MRKTVKSLVVIILLAIVTATAAAQTITPRPIESIDLTALKYKTIVVGRVTKLEDAGDRTGYQNSATIEVEKTLKGTATSPFQVPLDWPPSMYKRQMTNSSRLLVAIPLSRKSRTAIFELDQKPFLASRSDFSLIPDTDTFIQVLSDLIATHHGEVDERMETIRAARDVAKEAAWTSAYGREEFYVLCVPIDQALEKIAWDKLKSDEYSREAEGARYLKYFKSPENIERVKGLLNSPNSIIMHGSEESFGADDRLYYTRRIAFDLLKEWKVEVQTPILQESDSRLSEVTSLQFYKPISTETLIKLQRAKKLRDLELGDYSLSTDQMALLGKLMSLTKLNLTRLRTNDEGIGQLVTLNNLESLNLSGLPVTDNALASVAKMKSLKFVNVEMTWVTSNGLKTLRKARSDLKVLPVKPISSLLLNVINSDFHAVQATLDREPWSLNERYASSKGMTALHEAIELNRFDIAKLLLDRGANTEVVNDAGQTPLEAELSFFNPQDNMIRLLLGHGANLDHRRKDGTSLVCGIRRDWFNEHFNGTRMLLGCGAAPSDMLPAMYSNQNFTEPPKGDAMKLIIEAFEARKAPLKLVQQTKASCSNVVYKYDPKMLSQWMSIPHGGLIGPIRSSLTPKGRDYLGPFGQQMITLTLDKLRKHKNVHVSLESFIIGSWDGSGALGAGPDIFDIQVPNIGTLLHSTFFNNTEGDDAQLKLQSYPDPYQAGFHVGYTGAQSAKALGFTDVWDRITNHRDASYKLEYTFAHSGSTFQLNLNGITISEGGIRDLLSDEHWGIGNLIITTD